MSVKERRKKKEKDWKKGKKKAATHTLLKPPVQLSAGAPPCNDQCFASIVGDIDSNDDMTTHPNSDAKTFVCAMPVISSLLL